MDTGHHSRAVPFPRGVAAVEQGLGCSQHADAVVALELASGRERWRRSRVSGVPLAVRDGWLLVAALPAGEQSNALRLRVVQIPDPADGPAAGTAAAHPHVTDLADVVFPAWVNTADAGAFEIGASVEDKGITLEWSARRRYGGGAPPSVRALQAVARDAGGVVRLAFAGGRPAASKKGANAGKVRTIVSDVGPSRAQTLASVGFDRELLAYERTSQTARGTASRVEAEPWDLAGRSFALVAEDRGGDDVWLVLHSDGPVHARGRAGATVDLVRLPPDRQPVLPRLTRDRRFLLVRTDSSGRWSNEGGTHCAVFQIDTGRRLGTLPVELDAADPCVVGERLFFVTATALVAARLGDGVREWSWALPRPERARADTRGPPPLRR